VRPLPTYYYLSHFHEFLKFVSGPCGALLDNDDRLFLRNFLALSHPQQCLVVRFINRKSVFINPSSYQYEEIDSIDINLKFLLSQGWFTPLNPAQTVDFIEHLTKDEIIRVIDELNTN
jgi:DNA polymerase-3 subunit epsilon